MSVQGQLLEVTVVGCRKLKDTEVLSKQDPYVILEYGSTKFRTKTDTDGGKNPSFNEKFMLSLIEGLREVNVQVWNSNSISFDDFIGSGKIQLQKALSSGYDDNSWPLATRSGKHAGEIRVIMHYANAKSQQYGAPSTAAPFHTPPPAAPVYQTRPPTAPYAMPAGYPPQPAPTSNAAYPPAGYPPSGYPPPAAGSSMYGSFPSGYPPSHGPPLAQPGYGVPPHGAYPPPAYPPQPGYGVPPHGAYPPPAYPPQPGYGAPPPAAYPHHPVGSGAIHPGHHGEYKHGKQKHKYKNKHKRGKFRKWKSWGKGKK